MKKVAIVGAGIGGLSSCAHLLSKGYDVSVFESYSSPGGRARKIVKDGFTLECGPTVFTMLDVAEQPFAALDQKMSSHVEMLDIDPAYRGVFHDGSELSWPNKKENIFEAISNFSSEEEAQRFDTYVSWLKKLYDLEYEPFIASNFNSTLDLVKSSKKLLGLLKMGAFRKMDTVTHKLLNDQRLIDLCSFQSLYAGVTPQQALGIYCVISYMDLIQGVYAPKGGMSAYPEALAASCINAGAKIHYDQRVLKVSKTNNDFFVETSSGIEIFDAVISNADLPMSFPEIFDMPIPKKAARGKYSPSCLLYVCAAKTKIPEKLAHHNIYFSKSTKSSFDDLVKNKKLMADPSYLISIPSFSDRSLVKDDNEIFYVLEPCPNLESKVDFITNKETRKAKLRDYLKSEGIDTDQISADIYLDPKDWEAQKMYQGTPFSMSHTFFQSGPYRLRNYVKNMPGLFFCGTATTPGVGVPMVIESGKLAAERVTEYLNV